MHPSLVFLSLLLLTLSSGCFGSHTSGQPPVTWGLGLEVPATLPAPGSFQEGQANTTALRQVLSATIPAVLRECGASPEAEEAQMADLATGNLVNSVLRTLQNCSMPFKEGVRITADARRNGTEAQTFAALRHDAVAAVARQAEWLSSRPAPGSMADAQVLGQLMSGNAYYWRIIRTADSSFADYNQTRNYLDLEAAYLNLIAPIKSGDKVALFGAHYPWTEGVCVPPDVQGLARWLRAEADWILNASFELEPPSPGFPVSELYGSTLQTTLPTLEYHLAHGWWPGLLRLVRVVSFDRATLETHDTNRLPTREEARFLLAVHQHENRTWDGESQVQDLSRRVNDFAEWETHEFEARQALALSKMRSGFAQLRCYPITT